MALCGKFEEHFVTAAYLFVDLEKNQLRYSAAGHPPLMLVSHGADKTREIEENGLMLGMFPEADYSAAEIGIGTGDRCLLYTDGVLKLRTPRRRNSAGYAAENFWRRIETFLRGSSWTLS